MFVLQPKSHKGQRWWTSVVCLVAPHPSPLPMVLLFIAFLVTQCFLLPGWNVSPGKTLLLLTTQECALFISERQIFPATAKIKGVAKEESNHIFWQEDCYHWRFLQFHHWRKRMQLLRKWHFHISGAQLQWACKSFDTEDVQLLCKKLEEWSQLWHPPRKEKVNIYTKRK